MLKEAQMIREDSTAHECLTTYSLRNTDRGLSDDARERNTYCQDQEQVYALSRRRA